MNPEQSNPRGVTPPHRYRTPRTRRPIRCTAEAHCSPRDGMALRGRIRTGATDVPGSDRSGGAGRSVAGAGGTAAGTRIVGAETAGFGVDGAAAGLGAGVTAAGF